MSKKVFGIIIIVVAVSGVAISVFFLVLASRNQYMYTGRYSSLIREYYSFKPSTDVKAEVLDLVNSYWEDIIAVNTTIKVVLKPNQSSVNEIIVHGGESIHVGFSSNGTILYMLSRDQRGMDLLYPRILIANATINITDKVDILHAYLIFYTNETKPVCATIVITRIIDDPSSFQRKYGALWTVFVVNHYIMTRYRVERVDDLGKIVDSRDPVRLFSSNESMVNEYEAIGIMKLILDSMDVENEVAAIDLDGDGEADHLALLARYGGSGEEFLVDILTLLGDLGRVDVVVNTTDYKVKYVNINGKIYIVLDPIYTVNPYIPGYMDLPEKYKILGIVPTNT